MTSAFTPRLELRQSQSQTLVMTQALQQSIKLLQMNAMEVKSFIEEQLESNPFLQEGGDGQEGESEGDGEAPAEAEYERREAAQEAAPEKPDATEESFTPEEWHDGGGMSDGSQLRTRITARDSNGDELDPMDTREREVSLREHLLEQLYVSVADPVRRRIGMHLIDLTAEDGYIREDLGALADQLGAELAHVDETLKILQTFEPAGICARNARECLGLQLRERDRFDPAMQALLENLNLLADGNLDVLKRRCGVDDEDLRDMIGELKSLDPKPGLQFSHEVVQTVEPDITVKRDNTGNWHVELNAAALPRVLVNRRYYAKIAANSKGEDRKYMSERLTEANWLIKALDQRANTILKVATSIVAEQEGFFRMGIHHLKPLTLKDIARETGFHESTVSRVTSGKYMVTPRGTFELKYFFTSGVSHGAGGDDVSSETVKHVIREMIENEKPAAVLSDDDLAERLKARNINVARRTVAKYRESMNIPSSMQRRRLKAMTA